MIVGIGIDVERPSRFGFVFNTAGKPFYTRVFTHAERNACGRDLQRLALVYTAKEAISKVLGSGMGLHPSDSMTHCRDVEIRLSSTSAAGAALSGAALAKAEALGIVSFALAHAANSQFCCCIAAGLRAVDSQDAVRALLQEELTKIGMS